MEEDRNVTIMVVPEGEKAPRTFRFSRRSLKRLTALSVVALLLGGLALASWGYLAARAWKAGELEIEVAELREDRERVATLAATLAEVEAAYERIRDLYGPEAADPEAVVDWLPPAGGRPAAPSADGPDGELAPTSWPLSQAGFLSRALVEDVDEDHPGIDIAVPRGSYIRAAGPGWVVEADRDDVYGNYVVLEHGDGYRSLYAHAERLLVGAGAEVRRGEVIALTGSTGRSTAPHLHFEILRDGERIDPMTLVEQP